MSYKRNKELMYFLQVFTYQVEKVGIHPISSLLITQDNLTIKAIANRYSRWVAIYFYLNGQKQFCC